MIDLCKNAFTNGKIPEGINDTFLCLIPKIPNANNLKKFRSIGLCNTVYKIIIKNILNCLKPFMNNLISLFQFSFTKNRKACDNAIIIQELLLKMNKYRGENHNMILKLT